MLISEDILNPPYKWRRDVESIQDHSKVAGYHSGTFSFSFSKDWSIIKPQLICFDFARPLL